MYRLPRAADVRALADALRAAAERAADYAATCEENEAQRERDRLELEQARGAASTASDDGGMGVAVEGLPAGGYEEIRDVTNRDGTVRTYRYWRWYETDSAGVTHHRGRCLGPVKA